MKKVHIISIGDARLCDLAISFAQQGHQVTCSGVNIMEPERVKLSAYNLLPTQEGWFPETLNKDYDIVIPSNDLDVNNPEFLRAKELSLLVLSYPEYVYSRFKNKTRVLVSGGHQSNSIISMMSYALKVNHILFDHVYSESLTNQSMLNWGYSARIAIVQDDARFSPYIKKQINDYYRPHILVVSHVDELQGMSGLPEQEKKAKMAQLVSSIMRDGKFIYNQHDPVLAYAAELVREDVTAIAFTKHGTKEGEDHVILTRYGEFEVGESDDDFLLNLNAARITARQLGLNDKHFYKSISEYSQGVTIQ